MSLLCLGSVFMCSYPKKKNAFTQFGINISLFGRHCSSSGKRKQNKSKLGFVPRFESLIWPRDTIVFYLVIISQSSWILQYSIRFANTVYTWKEGWERCCYSGHPWLQNAYSKILKTYPNFLKPFFFSQEDNLLRILVDLNNNVVLPVLTGISLLAKGDPIHFLQ